MPHPDMTRDQTHQAASSTQGFAHIKLQNLIQSQQTGKTTNNEDKTTMDAATTKKYEDGVSKTLAGSIAKTEAGDGMFGADIELESLTDESGDDSPRDKAKGEGKLPKSSAKF